MSLTLAHYRCLYLQKHGRGDLSPFLRFCPPSQGGSGLADGINQGAAGPDEFRTAPLWGVGQRLFFLHDGRTSDLLQAIWDHSSPGNVCATSESLQQFTASNGKVFQPFSLSQSCGSEANGV